jgi:thioredoxin 1
MATIKVLTHGELESKVLQAPGPVALDFYQASCAPCRALEPRLERIARKSAGRVPVYRVDIDRDLAVAERFGVRSIPTVFVLRAGKEAERLDGLIREADLAAAFERAAHASIE